MALLRLSAADAQAAARAVAAILADPRKAGDWRGLLAGLSDQGRAVAVAARPLEVLTTALYHWRMSAPVGAARMRRTVAAAGLLLASNRICPYIAQAQAAARKPANA